MIKYYFYSLINENKYENVLKESTFYLNDQNKELL